jgi:hypothetical protein
MRRLRRTGARDPTTGEVVVIPRLPPVAGASKAARLEPVDPRDFDELARWLDRARRHRAACWFGSHLAIRS